MDNISIPPLSRPAEQPKPKRNRRWLLLLVAVGIVLLFWTQIGFYSVQPIGALPNGATAIVWRSGREPFFNSPDAMCLMVQGSVSLLCRGIAMGQAPVDRIILRLPYQEWAYLASTGGKTFDR
jgi:hypothetical protein